MQFYAKINHRSSDIEFCFKPEGKAKGTLIVKRGDDALYFDRVDLVSRSSCRRFIKELLERNRDLDDLVFKASVDQELMRMGLAALEHTPADADEEDANEPEEIPCSSGVLKDGQMFELAYNLASGKVDFVLFNPQDKTVQRADAVGEGRALYTPPHEAQHLCTPGMGVKSGVVLLPTEPSPYESEQDLENEIRSFIHKYVELPEEYEAITARYVMFTWFFDRFDEVPYLRFFSHISGCGKSRALEAVGVLCYRPLFVAGSSTSAATRRLIDSFRGTLVGDEQDFKRDQDMTSDYVKALNQGFQRGRPIVVCNKSGDEMTPQMFNVYGPKLLVSRRRFGDDALESRCFTIPMYPRKRNDISLNLPREEFDGEAVALRNKLLQFRFDRFPTVQINPSLQIDGLEDRLNQIGVPLLSTVTDDACRERIRAQLRNIQRYLVDERSGSHRAEIVRYLRDHWADPEAEVYLKDLADHLRSPDEVRIDSECVSMSPKKMGKLVRDELGLSTKRKGNGYIVERDMTRLAALVKRYGLDRDTPA